MGSLQPWHWVIVAVVFMALFGYKKLPDATRSVGRSLRIFKSEMKEMTGGDDSTEDAKPASPQQSQPQQPSVIEGRAVEQPSTDQTQAQSQPPSGADRS